MGKSSDGSEDHVPSIKQDDASWHAGELRGGGLRISTSEDDGMSEGVMQQSLFLSRKKWTRSSEPPVTGNVTNVSMI